MVEIELSLTRTQGVYVPRDHVQRNVAGRRHIPKELRVPPRVAEPTRIGPDYEGHRVRIITWWG